MALLPNEDPVTPMEVKITLDRIILEQSESTEKSSLLSEKACFTFTVRVYRAGSFARTPIRIAYECNSSCIMNRLNIIFIGYIAKRYTNIEKLVLEDNKSSSGLQLQQLLKPFADAGHWKTSLKWLFVRYFNVSEGDESQVLKSYPENLETMIISLST